MEKSKRNKLIIGVVIGVVLTGITMFVLFIAFIWLFLTGGSPEETTDIERYQEIFDFQMNSGLLVFPEQMPEDGVNTEFYSYYRDTFGSPTYQIYLKCTYEPDEYEAEVERLEYARKIYSGTEKKLLRDEDSKYGYPAYIAIENHHDCYEYALLTGEYEIVYISTAFIEREDVYFDEKYLPSDYMTNEGESFTSGYSIYIAKMDSWGIEYDSTRNEYYAVTDAHMEQIEDSYFVVRTEHGEDNREIITECVFYYHESLFDEEVDDTVYSDINGMEYRGLSLNKDRTKAIVTYYDGDTEKEFIVTLPFPEEE